MIHIIHEFCIRSDYGRLKPDWFVTLRAFSINRSSHQWCSMKKGVHRNFTKFTGKHLCQSLFFNKVASLRPAVLLKTRLWHRCFHVNFVKFQRTPSLQNISGGCFWIKIIWFRFYQLDLSIILFHWRLLKWILQSFF